ncbi:MAG: hypothetical protein EOP88_16180 [Verrucomicrobiaceae bacterium]|nr:MAG: hypothetical protein EOP88_16180 [Verrucomicrobiaceae bacterium]
MISFCRSRPFHKRPVLARPVVLLGIFAGLVGMSRVGAITAHLSSVLEAPVTASGFTATGDELELSLGFTPPPGADLKVVENTGGDFIEGRFTNLSQGQPVTLTHDGVTYQYVANYHGGNGNDLVLHRAGRKLVSWGKANHGQLGNYNGYNPTPAFVNQAGVLQSKSLVSVSSKTDHVVALCSDGTVVAWGRSDYGQIGDGDIETNKNVPVKVDHSGVLAGKTVIAVSAGDRFSLALCSDGTVAAWGWNAAGQLGNGTLIQESSPVAVSRDGFLAGKTVVQISAGFRHSVVLCSDGTLFAWGRGEPLPLPVEMTGVLAGKTVTSISAGRDFTLALCSDGKMVAWGLNSEGQLGNNSTTASNVPVAVTDTGALLGKNVISISAGQYYSLATCEDGSLISWGYNFSGTLGNGTKTNSRVPLRVESRPAIAISAGVTHSMSFFSDGAISAWGSNSNWGVSQSLPPSESLVPAVYARSGTILKRMFPSAGVATSTISLVLGTIPTDCSLSGLASSAGVPVFAVSPEGAEYALSVSNSTGTITLTPSTSNPLATITVNGMEVESGSPSGDIVLSPGISSILVVVTAEDGTRTRYVVKVMRKWNPEVVFESDGEPEISFPFYDATGLFISLSLEFSPATGTNLMVVNNSGISHITGRFTNLSQGQPLDLVHEGKVYRFVANYYGGTGNDLVLEWANRSIASWGSNSWSELGVVTGSSASSTAPLSMQRTGVLFGKCVTSVAIGNRYGMALCADGSVAHWGHGSVSASAARMSDNSEMKRVVAISAANMESMMLCEDGTILVGYDEVYVESPLTRGALEGKTVVAISKGGFHMLALCSDGTIAGWGNNAAGQLGNGTTNSAFVSTPVAVATNGALAGKSVIAVTTGIHHSMALCSDGTLVSWGSNSYGQLGNGSTLSSSLPVDITGIGALEGKRIVGLAQGGENFSVVICSDGTVVTWGKYWDGQLGRLDIDTSSTIPGQVATEGALFGKDVVSIASGFMHNVAVCSDGTVVTWGSNNYGQLGNNSTTRSNVPVTVYGNGELYEKKALSVAAGTHTHAIMAEPENGYAAWASAHQGISDKRHFSDPDKDGITNLMEYVLGGHPGASSTSILPTQSTDGASFVFDFTRLVSSASDVSQDFQYSTDMTEWHDVEISPATDSHVTLGETDGQGRQAVRVAVPKVSGEKMFGRLKVRQP